MAKRGYPIAVFEVGDDSPERLTVVGRPAETLLLLRKKGSAGVTAFDFAGGPAFRLGAYVCDLRRLGLTIRTDREPHEGGIHARYVLECPVRPRTVTWSRAEVGDA